VISSSCEESDYICSSCSAGFCLCGTCLGCPGGCPGSVTQGVSQGVEGTTGGTAGSYGTMESNDNVTYGLGNNDNLGSNAVDVPLLIGLLVAALVLIAIAITVIVLVMKKKLEEEKLAAENNERRPTVDIADRSERYSGLKRKFDQ